MFGIVVVVLVFMFAAFVVGFVYHKERHVKTKQQIRDGEVLWVYDGERMWTGRNNVGMYAVITRVSNTNYSAIVSSKSSVKIYDFDNFDEAMICARRHFEVTTTDVMRSICGK